MLNITEEEIAIRRKQYGADLADQYTWLDETMAEIIQTFHRLAPNHTEAVSKTQVYLTNFCHVQQECNKIIVRSLNSDRAIGEFTKSTESSLRLRLVWELGRLAYS